MYLRGESTRRRNRCSHTLYERSRASAQPQFNCFYFLFVWRKCVSVSIIASRNCHPKCTRQREKNRCSKGDIRLQFSVCPASPVHEMFDSVHCVNIYVALLLAAARKVSLFCHYLIGCCIGLQSSLSRSLPWLAISGQAHSLLGLHSLAHTCLANVFSFSSIFT